MGHCTVIREELNVISGMLLGHDCDEYLHTMIMVRSSAQIPSINATGSPCVYCQVFCKQWFWFLVCKIEFC